MDVHLPDMDGLQLLKCINKDYDIPVILTTDDVMHELIGDGLNNGAESCLLKPILPDAVRDIWQFYELRKVNKNIHTMSGSSLAKVPSSIGPSTTDNPNDKPARSSSRLIMNAMSAPNYAPCADINIKADWLSNGIATSENDGNLNIGNIVESNHAYYNRYEAGEKGDYNQTTLTPHQNNKFSDGGLLGGANISDWLHATNLTVLSGSITESIHNTSISQPPLNPEAQGNIGIFNRNNFNGVQTRYMQPTHSGIGASLVANQDEYTFPVNKKPRNGDDDCNELNNFDLLSFNPDSSKVYF
ncbi:hypothetical protein ACET3Z_021995 [Daucus carota]